MVCRMNVHWGYFTLFCLALATAQDQPNVLYQHLPVLPSAEAPGAGQCLQCVATTIGGQVNSSIGCEQPHCGYCSLQSSDSCTNQGPDGSALCLGFCSGLGPDAGISPTVSPQSPNDLVPVTPSIADAAQSAGTSFVIFGPVPLDLLQVPESIPEIIPVPDSDSTFAVSNQTQGGGEPQIPETSPVAAPSPSYPLTILPSSSTASPVSAEEPPLASTSPEASPSSLSAPVQCTATVMLSNNWSSSPGVTYQSANVFIKNVGSTDIEVPYAVTITIPGLQGIISNWNWGSLVASGDELTGQLTVAWETLEANQGNEVIFGAIIQLDSAQATTVQPSSIAINDENCVLY